jgi:hypothetical protein
VTRLNEVVLGQVAGFRRFFVREVDFSRTKSTDANKHGPRKVEMIENGRGNPYLVGYDFVGMRRVDSSRSMKSRASK